MKSCFSKHFLLSIKPFCIFFRCVSKLQLYIEILFYQAVIMFSLLVIIWFIMFKSRKTRFNREVKRGDVFKIFVLKRSLKLRYYVNLKQKQITLLIFSCFKFVKTLKALLKIISSCVAFKRQKVRIKLLMKIFLLRFFNRPLCNDYRVKSLHDAIDDIKFLRFYSRLSNLQILERRTRVLEDRVYLLTCVWDLIHHLIIQFGR